MARGRRSIPNEIKLLKGNPGKRKLALKSATGEASVELPRIAVSIPEFLTHIRERKIFCGVIDDYLQRRIARAPDSISYGRWASYVHLWMSCKEELEGKSLIVESTATRGGMLRTNPLLKGMLDIEGRLQPLEAQLGLNPAARQSIIRGLSTMPAAFGTAFEDEPTESEKPEVDDAATVEASPAAPASPLGFLQTSGKPH